MLLSEIPASYWYDPPMRVPPGFYYVEPPDYDPDEDDYVNSLLELEPPIDPWGDVEYADDYER